MASHSANFFESDGDTMEKSVNDLLSILEIQSKKIEGLEEKVADLTDYILRLSVSKESNNMYPYYDFIVSNQLSYSKRTQIESLFGLLTHVTESNTIPEYLLKSELSKGIRTLLNEKPLNYNNVKLVMMEILDTDSKVLVYNLVKNMNAQGLFKQVTSYLLAHMNSIDYDFIDK